MTEAQEQSEQGAAERKRPVPRVALLGPERAEELLAKFPGRFIVRRCRRTEELDSLLLSGAADLVVIDCRESVPHPALLELVRHEGMIDFLAVGIPEDRRSVPSWMRSHWCPWPVDRRSFYRLVMALARKAAWERAFRRQSKQVQELSAEADLGRKLAQVLHELNNPLDAVMRFVRLALDEQTEDEPMRWLSHAELGLKRMAHALEELHRDGRQVGSRLSMVELRELVREAAVTSGLIESEIELGVHIEDHEVGVPQALGPVLVNLLKNAAQACSGRGRVELRSERRGDSLRISVEDDGEGFGELFKEELFKPWFSTRESGTGLGLHAARIAVEQLGGKLDASSPGVGEGATFSIDLPLFDRDDQVDQSPEEELS